MGKKTGLLLICFFLVFSRYGISAERRGKLAFRGGARIQGLKWSGAKDNLLPLLRMCKRADKTSTPCVQLEGDYLKPGGLLLLNGRLVKLDAKRHFRIYVPITSRNTAFRVTAGTVQQGKQGRTLASKEEGQFSVLFDGPKTSSSTKASSASRPAAKKLWIVPGIGFTLLSYQQTKVEDLSEWLITPKLTVSYPLDDKWTMGGNIFYTLLPLQSSSADKKIQVFGSNARVGYRLSDPKPDWEFTANVGWYYSTSMSNSTSLGYKDVSGPQIFPTVKKTVFGNPGSFYFKYSPILGTGLSNNEMALGGMVLFGKIASKNSGVTLDYARMSLTLSSVSVTSTSLTLGILLFM